MAASYTPNAAYSSESVPFRATDASYSYDGSQASPRQQISPAPRQGPAVAFAPVSVSNAWPLILPYLDLPSYVVSQSACTAWRSIAMLYNVGVQILEKYVKRGLSMANLCQTKTNEAVTSGTQNDSVLSFLADTLLEEMAWLKKLVPSCTELSANIFFLNMFDLHLIHIESLLNGLGESQWKELDVWSVSRSLRQMQVLFPQLGMKNDGVDFERMIRDRDARAAFKKALGPRSYPRISFDALATALRWPSQQLQSLQQVLDFPRDGVITPYKWHVFTSLFGPWKTLKPNFERFVLGGGFAGCISRQSCESLLKQLPPKTVIMRSSRTHASMLVLSYRASRRSSFVHLTNNSNFWTLPEFVVPLQAISREKGALPSTSNVPMEYFVLLFERCGYSIAPVLLGGELPLGALDNSQVFSSSLFSSSELQNANLYSYSAGYSAAPSLPSASDASPSESYAADLPTPSSSSARLPPPPSSSSSSAVSSTTSSAEFRAEYYSES